MNPGEVHDGAPIGDAGRAWQMLYLDLAPVLAALADLGLARPEAFACPAPVLADARTAGRLGRLLDAARAPGAALAFRAGLLDLLAGLPDGPGAPPAAALPAGVARAKAWIDDDPAAGHTLADLAAAAGLGRFQLLRAFARTTGLTPHAYRVQQRLALARRLIWAGAPLAEAAAAAGFADQSQLTRLFVRTFGVAPGAYARACR